MNKQRAFALLTLAAAGFAVYRATRRMESAAEDFERRGLKGDVVMSALVAIVALAFALKKTGEAASKVRETF